MGLINKADMQYRIVDHWSRNSLEDMVNTLLSEGWLLHGGVTLAIGADNNKHYAQVLISYTNMP